MQTQGDPGSRKAVKSRKPGVTAHTYNPSTERKEDPPGAEVSLPT